MAKESVLSDLDFEGYLLYLYFGPGDDPIANCVRRAYLDMCRTLRGVGAHPCGAELSESAHNLVRRQLVELRGKAVALSQEGFDAWHHRTCQELTSVYAQYSLHFLVGQGQKWINMALKYAIIYGPERAHGFELAYPLLHAPLDNVLIEALKPYGFPGLSSAWSRLSDYDEYLGYQKWMRQSFSACPMDVEFLLWMGRDLPDGTYRETNSSPEGDLTTF